MAALLPDQYPKVLVVMTSPFNTGGSSRTLDSYFHFWDKKCVAHVYSRNCEPTKGHCGTFYQITDERLVKRWLGGKQNVGRVFRDDDLKESDELADEYSGSASRLGYSIGAKHTPTIELLRGLLWRKRFWCTPEFIAWLDEFKPDCVLYNFSNHLFTQDIALFASERFDIPIIPVIGDDYYFNDGQSISPMYHLFRRRFKKLTNKIMSRSVNAVYCSEKCMKKYGEYFGLSGKPIYVSSQLLRRDFHPINKENPFILYCGSVKLGRNHALVEIANALRTINENYKLRVYSGDTEKAVCKPLLSHPNIFFGGRIGYERVTELVETCDIFVVAEGFREEDLQFTRYSLSTKAADGLASGASILAYGPSEAGVIEYLSSTNAAEVCDQRDKLTTSIMHLIEDESFQKRSYETAIQVTENNHSVESSTQTFSMVVSEALALSKEMVC